MYLHPTIIAYFLPCWAQQSGLALRISASCTNSPDGYTASVGYVGLMVLTFSFLATHLRQVNRAAPRGSEFLSIRVTSAMTTRPISSCQAAATTTRTLTDLDATIFTPPASCLESLYKQSPYGYDTIEKRTERSVITVSGIQGQITSTSVWTSDYVVRGRDPSCFPRNFPSTTCPYLITISSTTRGRISEQSYIYSPGRCPENYVTATSSIDEVNTDITRGICCPV